MARRRLENAARLQEQQNAGALNEKRENYEAHLAAINRVADALETTKTQEQTDDDKRAFREKVTIALLVAAVIFSFAADVIFYLSLKDSHVNSREQLSKMEEASRLVRESNQINKESMEASARAWVGPNNASVIGAIEVGKPVTVSVSLYNTGREPARSFTDTIDRLTTTGDSMILSMDTQDFVAKCFAKQWTTTQSRVLYPSSGFGNGFDSQVIFPSEWITQDVIKGNTILIVRGCIVYESFAQTRHSAYCYFYKGGTTKPDHLNICSGGSGAN